VGQRALEHLAVQRLLGREVVEEAGTPDAHPGGDVVERRPLVPLLGEAVQRFSEDRLTRRRHVLAVGHVSIRLLLGCPGAYRPVGRRASLSPACGTTSSSPWSSASPSRCSPTWRPRSTSTARSPTARSPCDRAWPGSSGWSSG